MYETGVMSVCNYAAEIWGYKDFKFCKKYSKSSYAILFRGTQICTNGRYAGWLRVAGNNIQKNRIMKMDDSTLVKHIFNYDYGICQNNWSADMKYIFSMLDMNDVFNNALMCNMKSANDNLE